MAALLLAACGQQVPTTRAVPAAVSVGAESPSDGSYQITVTGQAGQSSDTVKRQMLGEARALAVNNGRSAFAVLEQSAERIGSQGPTYGARIPVVRSRSGSSRRSSGPVGFIDLGSNPIYRVTARVLPFDGDPPANAAEVYQVDLF